MAYEIFFVRSSGDAPATPSGYGNSFATHADTVIFNAGNLSTISDCVSEVESKLKRGTLSTATTPTLAQVQGWLSRKKQELAEVKNFQWKRKYAYADTTAGSYRHLLPADMAGGWVSVRDTTNDEPISLWETDRFQRRYPDPSAEGNSTTFVGCFKNNELWLAPPPAGAYRLELEYHRSGDDDTNTDVSWLPEIERYRICDGAIHEAFLSLHMWNEARMYEQKWNYGLGRAIRADGKRRWQQMNYQGMSLFQTDTYRIR
jgi:hypothetical protein